MRREQPRDQESGRPPRRRGRARTSPCRSIVRPSPRSCPDEDRRRRTQALARPRSRRGSALARGASAFQPVVPAGDSPSRISSRCPTATPRDGVRTTSGETGGADPPLEALDGGRGAVEVPADELVDRLCDEDVGDRVELRRRARRAAGGSRPLPLLSAATGDVLQVGVVLRFLGERGDDDVRVDLMEADAVDHVVRRDRLLGPFREVLAAVGQLDATIGASVRIERVNRSRRASCSPRSN